MGRAVVAGLVEMNGEKITLTQEGQRVLNGIGKKT
jgi:hypothetical protein